MLLRFQVGVADGALVWRDSHIGKPSLELIVGVDGTVAKLPKEKSHFLWATIFLDYFVGTILGGRAVLSEVSSE